MILAWRKSSYSGGADDSACVEVAASSGGVSVRDSKNPDGDHLSVTGAEFTGLVRQIKVGALDRP
ncbi:DUF397 domain-containing protein [Actinomadura geliboluensis]|uniref:DUF397 domain-containing protein n=1 Tax=Actinomadura geliboluensis TaxID=882440 RepID=UPI0036AB61EC